MGITKNNQMIELKKGAFDALEECLNALPYAPFHFCNFRMFPHDIWIKIHVIDIPKTLPIAKCALTSKLMTLNSFKI